MDDIKISTNWIFEGENKLKNLVTFIQPDMEKRDIEHITPDTCICLTKKESDTSDSKPELNINLKNLISELNVFSEGSLIEVFGEHDEYLFTCVPDFVDDWEGMAVYYAKIALPDINTCKLKFTRIKEEGRLWLYSVQLSVVKAEKPSNYLLFNFENVNRFINNSSQQISEKADRFKKFFELYAKNTSNTQPFNVKTLFDVINKERNIQFSDCITISDFLNASETITSSLTMRKDTNTLSQNDLPLECQYIKYYIDKKFIEMKDDVMKCIENKISELRNEHNARLDHMIKLLENSNLKI